MKKILIVLAAILVAVIVIGPRIVASKFSTGIQNSVQAINENPNYVASVTSIESSWFYTKAEVNIGIKLPDTSNFSNEEPLDFSINVNVEGNHGPILTRHGFGLGWLDIHINDKSEKLPDGFVLKDKRALYELNGRTSLFMTTNYTDTVAAFDYTDANSQASFSFSGTQGTGQISNSHLSYEGTIDSIGVDVEDIMNVELANFEVKISVPESLQAIFTQGLYNSESSISMASISINDVVKQESVLIDNSTFLGITTFDQSTGLGDIELKTSLESIKATNMHLSDINAVIQLKHLQAKFLLAYQDFAAKMMDNLGDPQQTEEDLHAFLGEYLLPQLQANPEYNLSELNGKINGSEFNGKVMAKLSDITELPDTLADPVFWIQHALVDSNLVLQKSAAEFIATTVITSQLAANPQFTEMSEEERTAIIAQQVAPTLDMLAQQGMIVINGENYEMTFTMQDGAVMLNDNPIPL